MFARTKRLLHDRLQARLFGFARKTWKRQRQDPESGDGLIGDERAANRYRLKIVKTSQRKQILWNCHRKRNISDECADVHEVIGHREGIVAHDLRRTLEHLARLGAVRVDPARLDKVLNVKLGGITGMTISERLGRARDAGDVTGKAGCRLLDRFDPGHCDRAVKYGAMGDHF